MLQPNGGFSSAEDADSEGEEGKFIPGVTVNTALEKQGKLPEHSVSFLVRYFGVIEEGNLLDEATKKRTGQNILHLNEDLDKTSLEQWKHIRSCLFKCRKQRVRPLCDDKILCDWNALLAAALAIAGRILGSKKWGIKPLRPSIS